MRLEARLTENSKNPSSPLKVGKLLDRAMEVLSNLDIVYLQGDVTVKRQVIGSIFPEKLVLEKNNCRTAKVNEVAGLIFQINSGLWDKKSRTLSFFSQKFGLVPGTGIEPVRALQLKGF